MIYKNSKKVIFVNFGHQAIYSVYKGMNLVWTKLSDVWRHNDVWRSNEQW